jgi:hypothetical protein
VRTRRGRCGGTTGEPLTVEAIVLLGLLCAALLTLVVVALAILASRIRDVHEDVAANRTMLDEIVGPLRKRRARRDARRRAERELGRTH